MSDGLGVGEGIAAVSVFVTPKTNTVGMLESATHVEYIATIRRANKAEVRSIFPSDEIVEGQAISDADLNARWSIDVGMLHLPGNHLAFWCLEPLYRTVGTSGAEP